MSESSNSGGGIGLLGMLGVLFIGLKLAGIITWSWWYVLLPLYGTFALVFAIGIPVLVAAGLVALAKKLIKYIKSKKK